MHRALRDQRGAPSSNRRLGYNGARSRETGDRPRDLRRRRRPPSICSSPMCLPDPGKKRSCSAWVAPHAAGAHPILLGLRDDR